MEQDVDLLDEFSPNVRKRLVLLLEIQGQHDEHKKRFLEERAALEAKYQKIYEPLHAKRYEIVNIVETVKNEAKEKAPEEDNATKGVPGFWLTAMKNNEVLAKEIQKRDEGALEYLKDIKWCRIYEPKGFKLDFSFDTNPYFKNPILTKTYEMVDDDEPILEEAVGTEIEWNPGKCLSMKTPNKKTRKKSKNVKPIRMKNCKSFFNFFNPPEIPAVEVDSITAEKLQNQMEQDYEIATTIRDKIIPRAVLWFIGEEAQEADLADSED